MRARHLITFKDGFPGLPDCDSQPLGGLSCLCTPFSIAGLPQVLNVCEAGVALGTRTLAHILDGGDENPIRKVSMHACSMQLAAYFSG